MERTPGLQIAALRKARGITQEALANAVQVSTQAVSKWENGGMPDTELLPRIAEQLDVSIDALFGRKTRKTEELEEAIRDKMKSTAPEQQFETALSLCWAMEQGMFGRNTETASLADTQGKYQNQRLYSSIVTDHGFTHMQFMPEQPYFLLVPDAADPKAAFLPVSCSVPRPVPPAGGSPPPGASSAPPVPPPDRARAAVPPPGTEPRPGDVRPA